MNLHIGLAFPKCVRQHGVVRVNLIFTMRVFVPGLEEQNPHADRPSHDRTDR